MTQKDAGKRKQQGQEQRQTYGAAGGLGRAAGGLGRAAGGSVGGAWIIGAALDGTSMSDAFWRLLKTNKDNFGKWSWTVVSSHQTGEGKIRNKSSDTIRTANSG